MPDKLPISLIEELFQTLKDTINKNTDKLDKLIEAQNGLSNYLKSKPSMLDLKNALDTHCKEAINKNLFKDLENSIDIIKNQYNEILLFKQKNLDELGKKPDFDNLKKYIQGNDDKYKQAIKNIEDISNCLDEDKNYVIIS